MGSIEACGSSALQERFIACVDEQMAPDCLVWVKYSPKSHARKRKKPGMGWLGLINPA